jgi:hypothetical protein
VTNNTNQPARRKRPRGAPKGNLNALKHGFYSRQLRPSEIKDLQGIQTPASLEPEIEMQRVVARRIMDMIKRNPAPDELSDLSKALATVVNCLNRLVRTQKYLGNAVSEDEETFLRVLMKVHEELNIGDDKTTTAGQSSRENIEFDPRIKTE